MEEIEKTDQPNPDDVLTAITSFNDPAIITNIFKELNWTYSFEIKEWLAMARQNANLAVKAKALIQLRKLLREAAEAAGYTANVSKTIPNAQGGTTTFSGKQMAGVLNPVKQIKSTVIKELQNGRNQEPRLESVPGINRECNRKEVQKPDTPEGSPGGTDTREQFPPELRRSPGSGRADPSGDANSGGLEYADGGATSGQRPESGRDPTSTTDKTDRSSRENDPCIQTRPPTCNHDLYPGISSAEEG